MVSYEPLFRLLSKRKLNISDVGEEIGISSRTRSKFGKNEYVSMEVIVRLCVYLDVPIENVVEVIRQK